MNEYLQDTGEFVPHLALAQDLSQAPYESQSLAHDVHNPTLPSEYRALASKEVYPEVE